MTYTLPADAADWATAWRDRINDREGFETATADFDATFRFEMRADDTYDGDPVNFRVTVADGVCTEATVADASADYDFALRGPYEAWVAMLEGELDVSESVMNGTFDVEGNTMTLLRRQDAITEMIAAAQNVDTEFAY
ncbi:SCP2 sterol-binding domain-containing protein [Halomicroarcula limicola]|uniref:SCP2 sterol-binding domain-containing protein n=1 Tax=Haloarcula limicola TaxID=1429915 RepID=A0A8J7Y5G1_9EURY|nr:SCP2 sterol-binding domain-containing protein [Halomicroarcula limicola]MBV0924412.1 SCP2 sterol-binding domain-containing protein [Halomicroarcula limicola]